MEPAKYEESIRKLIVQREANTTAQRSVIYAAARSSVAKNNPDSLSSVDEAIGNIEATFAAPPAAPIKKVSGLPLWLTIGAVLGIAMAAIWTAVRSHSELNTGGAVAQIEKQYEDALPQVPVAIDFIRKVSDAIIERQKSDPGSLAASSSRIVSLNAFDRDLAASMPKTLPAGTAIILRADARNFKVLMNWPLCGVVRLTNPEMVDPVRSATPAIGCPFFGQWTNDAARW